MRLNHVSFLLALTAMALLACASEPDDGMAGSTPQAGMGAAGAGAQAPMHAGDGGTGGEEPSTPEVELLVDAVAVPMVLAGDYLYWVQRPNPEGGSEFAAIGRVHKGGGTPELLAMQLESQLVGPLAAGQGFVFIAVGNSIYRLPEVGGEPVEYRRLLEPPRALFADERQLYVVQAFSSDVFRYEQGDSSERLWDVMGVPLAVAEDAIFWVEDGILYRREHGMGTTLERLHPIGPSRVNALAVKDGIVYSKGDAQIWALELSTGASRMLGNAAFARDALAVSEEWVYWLEERRLMRISRMGGEPEEVHRAEGFGPSLAVDEDYVYFVAAGIHRIAHR